MMSLPLLGYVQDNFPSDLEEEREMQRQGYSEGS